MTRIFLTFLVALLLGGPAFATTYSSFVTFGDSLSDDGKGISFFAPQAPYQGGGFSNGPVWAEYVAAEFEDAGLNTANFALGGATAGDVNDLIPAYQFYDAINPFDRLPEVTPLATFDSQIDQFEQSFASQGLAGDDPLVAVMFGANDIFGGGSPVQAALDVLDGIVEIASMGSEYDDFMVANLPNLGLLPDTADPFGEFLKTIQFNITLELGLRALEQQGINILRLDQFSLFEQLLIDAESLGITNLTDPCFVFPSATGPGTNCTLIGVDANGNPIFDRSIANTFLFVDDVHPNALVHELLGQEALALIGDGIPPSVSFASYGATSTMHMTYAVVAPVPVPAGGLLLLTAAGAFAMMRRRRAS